MNSLILLTLLCLGCAVEEKEVDSKSSCFDLSYVRTWERLGSPVPTAADGHFAPSLVVSDDVLWLYYAQRDNLEDTLFRITSTDGVQWTEPVSLGGFDGFTEIKHLNVIPSENGFKGFLGGGSIATVRSDDGLSWEIVNSNVIEPLDFDQLGQLYPVGNTAGDRLWYSGFDGTTFSIGMATKESDAWSSRGVVIEREPEASYENTAVAQSALLEVQERYLMFYGGYDTSQTDPGPWRILMATSNDGLLWDKNGLELDILPEGEEAWRGPTPAEGGPSCSLHRTVAAVRSC